MPTSNETRVRVDAFSKIMTSVRPRKRSSCLTLLFLNVIARSRISRSVSDGNKWISRKCLVMPRIPNSDAREIGADAFEDMHGFIDVPAVDNQRRHKADDVAAGDDG